ncbi:DNA-binding MurR/RpiR family transcriptional regulator [Mesorhizobium robiniae]|uniref:DNA-binding MurR/RpiR family transcriptional regulator n=1 Tax=Mesorhizobium robiniae TaxID=559315 RepID=A0ABV2GST1_9HYPH
MIGLIESSACTNSVCKISQSCEVFAASISWGASDPHSWPALEDMKIQAKTSLRSMKSNQRPRKPAFGAPASWAVASATPDKRIVSDRLEGSEQNYDGGEVSRILENLAAELELLPVQLRAAARFVLAHPKDVALKTMREQASLAGVSHSTMVRFAEWLGFDGYTELKTIFAAWLRQNAKAPEQISYPSEPVSTDCGNTTDWLRRQVARLGAQPNIERNVRAAEILAGAQRVISVGIGPQQLAVASHFVEVLRSLGRTAFVFDAAQPLVVHALKDVGPRDAILAIGMEPCIKQTLAVARYAKRRGVQIVAIVDQRQSPIEQYAQAVIVIAQAENRVPSLAPVIASVEILAALIEQSVSSEPK